MQTSQRGISLIEIMIVVGIVAMLAGIGAAATLSSRSYEVAAGASTFESLVATGRETAQALGDATTIYVAPNGIGFTAALWTGHPGASTAAPASGVHRLVSNAAVAERTTLHGPGFAVVLHGSGNIGAYDALAAGTAPTGAETPCPASGAFIFRFSVGAEFKDVTLACAQPLVAGQLSLIAAPTPVPSIAPGTAHCTNPAQCPPTTGAAGTYVSGYTPNCPATIEQPVFSSWGPGGSAPVAVATPSPVTLVVGYDANGQPLTQIFQWSDGPCPNPTAPPATNATSPAPSCPPGFTGTPPNCTPAIANPGPSSTPSSNDVCPTISFGNADSQGIEYKGCTSAVPMQSCIISATVHVRSSEPVEGSSLIYVIKQADSTLAIWTKTFHTLSTTYCYSTFSWSSGVPGGGVQGPESYYNDSNLNM